MISTYQVMPLWRADWFSSLSHNIWTCFFADEKCRGHSEVDGGSLSSSSGDSMSGAPSRLVPGHRIWANGNGRHILGLIEDYRALRKQILDGRTLSRSLIAQLQECVQIFKQSSSDKVVVFGICLVSLPGYNDRKKEGYMFSFCR